MRIIPVLGILKMRQLPQGPLPLRFSGICPDAFAQGLRTAHQFAYTPDAQSGLNPHCS